MSPYLRFLKYVQPYWHLVLAASVALIVSGFLGAYPIQLFKRAVDVAIGDVSGTALTFVWLAGQYILLRVVLGGAQLVESYLSRRLVQGVVFDLRSELYAHLQSLSIGFYETRGAGEIMSRALGDVGALAGGFVGPLTRLAGELTQLGWALAFLFKIDARLTLTSLIVAPPLGYAVYRFGNRMRDHAWQLRLAQSRLWSFLHENIAGIGEIKVFGRQEIELERFRERSRDIDRLGIQDSLLNAVLMFCTGLLFSVGEMVVLLLGGLSVFHKEMTPGNMTAFLMYVRLLYNPVITLGRRYDQTLRTLASAARVFEVLDTVPEIQDRPGAKPLNGVRGEVAFQGVSFCYLEGKEVLHDISFSVTPGEMIALVGHSGGGKTTISKLIPRFYDPDEGHVLVDGNDVRDVTVASLREQVAVVFQDPFLFNRTIRENILYGRPDANDDEMLAAARAANVDPFVVCLEEGYDTVIGERGVRLSGGQQQRVAIARALLKDPRILILDEATSAVDSETENLIQEALNRLLEGRTSLVIAHRLSTVLHADQILVVEGGEIVERGKHRELVARKGVYAALYRAQFEEGKRE